MSLRYAILHHTDWPGHPDHYDLLLQTAPGTSDDDRVLRTFSTLRDECPANGVLLIGNQDHRRLYLDYEGPVSGERGRDRRVDSGECRVEGPSVFTLTGGRLSGRITLMVRASLTYQLELEPAG
jgi:hypothetical protein